MMQQYSSKPVVEEAKPVEITVERVEPVIAAVEEADDLEVRRALVRDLLKAEADLETAKHRLNNDRSYIKLLHEYNYLKVQAFGVHFFRMRASSSLAWWPTSRACRARTYSRSST